MLNVSISLGEAAKEIAARYICREEKQIRRIRNKLADYMKNFQNFEKEKDKKERIELYKLKLLKKSENRKAKKRKQTEDKIRKNNKRKRIKQINLAKNLWTSWQKNDNFHDWMDQFYTKR